jgi:hypothetical protein
VYAGRPCSHCNFAAADGKTTSFAAVRYRSQRKGCLAVAGVQKPGKSQFGTKPASRVTSELAVTSAPFCFASFLHSTSVLLSLGRCPTSSGVPYLYRFFFAHGLDFCYRRQPFCCRQKRGF